MTNSTSDSSDEMVMVAKALCLKEWCAGAKDDYGCPRWWAYTDQAKIAITAGIKYREQSNVI